MLLLLIIIVPTIFLLARKGDDEDRVFSPSMLVVALGAIMLTLILSTILCATLTEMDAVPYKKTEELQLTNLATHNTVSGSFFLGSGTIEQEPHYFFYHEVNKGAFKLEYVSAENSLIIFDGGKSLEIHNPPWYLTSGLLILDDFDSRYYFHIPKGSIDTNFNPNLQGGK